MQAVNITRNAKLIKDDQGYWLAVTTSAGLSGLFSLSTFLPGTIEGVEQEIGFEDVLEAFMKDQQTPQMPKGSLN
jgi:hypothetical protein